MKILLLLILIVISCNADVCTVKEKDRIDCGYVGITQDQCVNNGCCWKPSDNNGIPWCFHNAYDDFCKTFNFTSEQVGFTEDSYFDMYDSFLANINIDGKGGVVASPDPNTPGGSYYFHWMRDAALSMKTFMIINDYDYETISQQMGAYASFIQRVQKEKDPHGQSVLNEPKFDLPRGGVYQGAWCRPQTDGPALRATTMMEWAQVLLNNGYEDQVDMLWNSQGTGIIQIDLDYIADNWQENGCDLWEEIRSTDFLWNKMSFHQALVLGSEFAQQMDDDNRYAQYKSVQHQILPTILNHYNGDYIYESTNRLQDSAVIHALVTLNEGIWDIGGKEAAGTVRSLNRLFCTEYKINQDQDQDGIPGILYGRYKGDVYAGGNPWQLLTATLAELFYQLAEKYEDDSNQNRTLAPSEIDQWRDILSLQGDVTVQQMAKASRKAGNSVMYRMWTHVFDNVSGLTEQMDRNNGFQISAKKLTWSFANVLRVLHQHVFNDKQNNEYQIQY